MHNKHRLSRFRMLVSCQCMLTLVLAASSMSIAEESAAPVQGPPSPHRPLPAEKTSGETSDARTVFTPVRDWWNDQLSWETGAGRSYVLPAGEIVLYEFLLNRFDRRFVE